MGRCSVCFRHCEIPEGKLGFCGARTCRDGKVIPANYGVITGIHLDPVEKKPLSRFYPGSQILSVGSYGCNLRCPFCQNHDISWDDSVWETAGEVNEALRPETGREQSEELCWRFPGSITPERLAEEAERSKAQGGIGIAFTYNEPLIGYEFVLDTARLVHDRGMKNVLVSNGMVEVSILEKLLPYIDAMNIDLKGFTDRYYSEVLKGDRGMVMDFIERAAKDTHLELTTLIIPEENDTEEEMRELAGWVANLRDNNGNVIGRKVPLHISRFFPRFHMTDRPATDVRWVYHLAGVAREKLEYVYTGNC